MRGSMASFMRLFDQLDALSSRSQPRVILRTDSRTRSRRRSSAPKRWNQSWRNARADQGTPVQEAPRVKFGPERYQRGLRDDRFI
jgi:hypothetical protein